MESKQWFYKQDDAWMQATRNELQEYFDEEKIAQDTLVALEGFPEPGIPFQYIDTEYFYEYGGRIWFAYAESELHEAAMQGKINPLTKIWGRTLPSKGITYGSFRFHDLTFEPEIKQFVKMRKGHPTTVLSGPNNSGKTLILKLLRKELGPAANFLACKRFYHPTHLTSTTRQEGESLRRHDSFLSQLFQQRQQNYEENDFQMPQVLGRMSDVRRDALLTLCSEMLDVEFCLEQEEPGNKVSPYYVDVGGENLAITSTGTRLLLQIVAACFDEHCGILLVDEPELGLSPALQSILARYLLKDQFRRAHFPHVKQLFIATHSHIFLDHSAISNNFVVTRSGNEVLIKPVNSMSAYHNLQFNMLGNDLEALFLPAAIVIVEGPSDCVYIRRVFQVFFPARRIAVVPSSTASGARGTGGLKDRLFVIEESLVDLMKSPYRERIFILLDQIHSPLKNHCAKHGVPAENVIVLDENGIEYYYPPEILSEIFPCGADDVFSLLEVKGATVKVRDVEMKKTELGEKVAARLTNASNLPEELWNKVLNPIQELID